METKIFGDKKIIIRTITKADIKRAGDFQKYINSLIKKDVMILINKPASLKTEKEFLKNSIGNKLGINVVAEEGKKIVGIADIKFDRYRKNHIGILGLSVKNGYRGRGLGEHLIRSAIDLACHKLKPKLKIILLTVYKDNKPAINLYKKVGFKKVAYIPDAIQYKGKLIGEYVMLLYV